MAIDLGAGGGASFFGQTLEATASGAIADGDPVVINSNGTVSAVSSNGTVVEAGTEMFFIGGTNDAVYKYNLSSPYDVSSAIYSGTFFSVSRFETNPTSFTFNSDGTKLFVMGYNGDTVDEFKLSSPYNIETASLTESLSITAQESDPQGLKFSPDGEKMYIVGSNGDEVNQYNLSTGFDISTAALFFTFSVAAQDTTPTDIAFNADGTTMFIAGDSGDSIDIYTLTTPYNINTASFSTSFSIGSQETQVRGLDFNPDGTKMFVSGLAGDDITIYNLTTGFDLSTATFSDTYSVASQDNGPGGIEFNTTYFKSNLTAANQYIGIADGAYADGTTATIQLVGSVDDAQSGLTAGEVYYVQNDGSLGTTSDTPKVEAGYAISPTELLVKGAYSVATASVFVPTPLADSTPLQYQCPPGDLLTVTNGTAPTSTNPTFWNVINLQGAYIEQTSATSYTEIVNVTGSGALGAVFPGSVSTNLFDVFIEVTIDDEVREWRIFSRIGYRPTLLFAPPDVLDRKIANGGGDQQGEFDTVYTTSYSTLTTDNQDADVVVLQPTILFGGIRFKKNMRVRIKCATTFDTTDYENRHGVIYVID